MNHCSRFLDSFHLSSPDPILVKQSTHASQKAKALNAIAPNKIKSNKLSQGSQRAKSLFQLLFSKVEDKLQFRPNKHRMRNRTKRAES